MKLGNRMKEYEQVFKVKLPKKHPVIIRVDGKAFHTLTRGLDKPFCKLFIKCMEETSKYLLENVQNCKMVYTQSDEISLLLDDRATEETECYFGNILQKLASITASMSTYKFNQLTRKEIDREGLFDSRAFILPDNEVPNYFLWRMQDWKRNSIQMLARSLYSQKQLYKKNKMDMMDMMMDKGVNWAKLSPNLKNGTILIKEDREVMKTCRKFNYKTLKEFISEL